MWDGSFENLSNGSYRFIFDANWNNGHKERDEVIVKIKDGWDEFYKLRRLEADRKS